MTRKNATVVEQDDRIAVARIEADVADQIAFFLAVIQEHNDAVPLLLSFRWHKRRTCPPSSLREKAGKGAKP